MPPVRLQKFLAEAGVGSRRACERLIPEGKIAVNSLTVTLLGTKINPDADRVTVGLKPVGVQRKVYLALNKPAGVLCTSRDTHGRKRVLDLLPKSLPRLYTVGRLDRDTEGLLFLTNDGSFSLRLTHPRYKMPKTYLAEVEGALTVEQTARLIEGIPSEGQCLRAEKVFEVHDRGSNTELQLVIREGKKRQIRRMMKAIGHPVVRLTRLSIQSVNLGELKTGQWRYLTDEEVRKLMHLSSPENP
jgi:23S rRNA pseudouridine2605 synthase